LWCQPQNLDLFDGNAFSQIPRFVNITSTKSSETIYKDGKIDGLVIYWYINGQKYRELTYKDDELISEKKWNEDGSIKE